MYILDDGRPLIKETTIRLWFKGFRKIEPQLTLVDPRYCM